jgi:Xaa-Pro aminopeptidase
MHRVSTLAALVSLSLACVAVPARGDALSDDLRARRARLMEALGPETLFLQHSAPPQVYSRDVDYKYRQDSDLLYLTGIDQEGTSLVLMPGNRSKKAILFVSDPNPRREHWNGHLLTKDEAKARSGVDEVRLASELDAFLASAFNRQPPFVRWTEYDGEYEAFFDAVAGGRARLAFVLGRRPGPGQELPPAFEEAERLRQRLPGATVVDATAVVWGLRQVKTAVERAALQRCADISGDAHRAAMRATRPGRFEYQVQAALEEVYLQAGAAWGYPSIVGSGPNATILHYDRSTRQMKDGELLLIDAAAFADGMTTDITRTWPVSGRFSPAQAELYRVVLAAQEAGMKAAVPGVRTVDVERAVEESVKAGLAKLGLVIDPASTQHRTWYTHGICHWIGADVHDVGDYRRPLQPGMAFTIEPGVYVREAALADLPDTPENKAFREKVAPALARYRDVGVRVEDSFLLTEQGLVRLSARVPRTIEEIEAFLAGRLAD